MFDWDEFLRLAEELAGRPGDEAAIRTAISRAYYATFHAGREYLHRANIAVDVSGRAHRHVRQVIQFKSVEASQDLARLHDWRKEADYENLCSFEIELIAPLALAISRSTIEMIRALP